MIIQKSNHRKFVNDLRKREQEQNMDKIRDLNWEYKCGLVDAHVQKQRRAEAAKLGRDRRGATASTLGK